MAKNNVVALIPARGGSKGVPRKNIRNLGGFPLLAYSVAVCKMTSNIERTVVSTDDEEIAEIARTFGAETPFMRPAEFATDKATDKDVMEHALGWFEKNEGAAPEYWIQIRPTTPLRDAKLLGESVAHIQTRPEATSLVSVHELEESPAKMFGMSDGYLHGLSPFDPRPEYFILPRQSFPPTYFGNGYVDIIRSSTLKKFKSCYGPRMLGFMTPDTGEVDSPNDLKRLNFLLEDKKQPVYEYLCSKFGHLKRESDPNNAVWGLKAKV